ncbi:kiSS-1 receptor-like [Diadema setosum]|uniref:kiSS-1 receptor-like n=1 Tax=Diadema setosum TaxID=31175 RepID=UPI003B3B47A2
MADDIIDIECSHVFLFLSCNLSMSTLPDDLAEQVKPVATPLFAFMLILMVIGVLGNSLVVYVICRKPNMMTAHNFHVANLAVIDLIFIIVCAVVDEVGIGLIAFQARILTLSSQASAGIMFAQGITFTATCGTMMCLAGERYRAIVKPLDTKKRRTIKNAVIQQCVVWAVSFVVGIVVALLESQPSSHTLAEGFLLYEVAFFYIGLIVVMFVCYAAILRSVHEHEIVEGDRVARWQLRRNMQMLRMVSVLVFAFLICRGLWLGYGFYVNHAQPPSRIVHMIVQISARFVCLLDSALNPFIYAIFMPDFKRHIRQLALHPFGTAKPRRRGTMDSCTRHDTVTLQTSAELSNHQ